jgi:hypothetical protein
MVLNRDWLRGLQYRQWAQNIHFCHVNGRWYFLSPDNEVVIGPFESEHTAQAQFKQLSRQLWDDNDRRSRETLVGSMD